MKIEVFEPLEVAEDVDEATRVEYVRIAEKLVKITNGQVEIERERQSLRGKGIEAENSDIDQMRRLSVRLVGLLREEQQIRSGELRPWFNKFGVAVDALSSRLAAKREHMRSALITKLKEMRFPANAIRMDFIDSQAEIAALGARLDRLKKTSSGICNSQNHLAWRPINENDERLEAIGGALRGIGQRNAAPIDQAAFI